MISFIEGEAALLLNTMNKKKLLIPDLHLGFETVFTDKGITLPSQTKNILASIQHLIRVHTPDTLVFMGDIKHETVGVSAHERTEIPEFFERLLTQVPEIECIPGNHDGGIVSLLPKKVIIHDSHGVTINDGSRKTTLIHGHTWPRVEALASNTLVMAHHHFTVEFRDKLGLKFSSRVWAVARWLREKTCAAFLRGQGLRAKNNAVRVVQERFGVKIGNPKIIVMPALNPLLGGWPINSKPKEEYLGPLFRHQLIDTPNAELYLLDGTFLGTVSSIDGSKRGHRMS